MRFVPILALALAPAAHAATTLQGPFDDSVASYDLVDNGDMEPHSGSTLSDWTDNYGGKLGYDSRVSYEGSGSAGLLDQSWTNTGGGVALRQSVSVTAGRDYVVSGYLYNGISGGGNVYLDLADQSYTQADGGSGDCSSLATSGLGDWEFVYCQFTVPSGTSSVTVRTVVDGTIRAGSYAYFDEVALSSAGSFSPPESLSDDGDGDGYSEEDGDCDDGDASISPGVDELCDGVDNDCDGVVDEDDATDASTWYADGDGDGYGDPASTTAACSQPSGYEADATDCDDGDASTHPGADEYCDGHDDDCDGAVDEDDAVDAATWYADNDGDGYGDAASTTTACSQPTGYEADATDCDDSAASTYPGADEYCDGHDDDCDGAVDEDDAVDAVTWYADSDGDGYGDPASTTTACSQPSGYEADATDCDDRDAVVHPGADEWCNGYDDNCDGQIDDSSSLDASTWYADLDGDGYGDPGNTTAACEQPPLSTTDASDCDDSDAAVHPGGTEVWYDGVDGDCDGASDYDQDGDGWDHDAYGGDDCDDDDAAINPDASEAWYDGVDQDCSGGSDYDYDGDGHDSASHGGDDCDDDDPDTYPGAPDEPYDGEITDCDASDEYDADGDGHPAEAYGGADCDDANSSVHPGAEEIWYDGIDQDCDGNDDDQDEDGWPLDSDCDDTDADIWPGAEGWDEDCNPTGDTGDTGEADTGVDTGVDHPGDTGGVLKGDQFLGGGGFRCSSTGAGGLACLLLGLLGLGARRRR